MLYRKLSDERIEAPRAGGLGGRSVYIQYAAAFVKITEGAVSAKNIDTYYARLKTQAPANFNTPLLKTLRS